MVRYGDLTTLKTADETRRDIERTFAKWGIDEFRIVPHPKEGYREPARVVYYVSEDKQELSCDRFPNYRTNLRAVYLVLEALRLAQERGILKELARAAAGLLAAPSTTKPAHEVLGISRDAPLSVAEAAYKALARERHPDRTGGSEAAMKELNEAFEKFKRERAG